MFKFVLWTVYDAFIELDLTVWLYGALVCLQETPNKLPENRQKSPRSEVKDYSYRDVPGFLVFSLFCGLLAPLHTMLCSWASKKRAGPRHYDG